MKKYLIIFMTVLSLLLTITSCKDKNNKQDEGDGEITEQTPQVEVTDEEKYDIAVGMIESGNYSEAYDILKTIENHKDASTLLGRFRFIPLKTSIVDKSGENVYESGYEVTLNDQNLPARYVNFYAEEKYIYDYSYDENGYVIQEIQTIDDEIIEIINYTYDKDGKITEAVHNDPRYDKIRIISYTYDSLGRLARENHEYNRSNYSYSNVYDYIYDSNGNLIEKINTTHTGSVEKIIMTYDSKGNLIKSEYGAGTGNTVYEFEYDENGNMTKQVLVSLYIDKMIYEYKYDENGKIIESIVTYSDGSQVVTKNEYDSHGKAIQSVSVDGYGIEVITDYNYDSYGNLVKMINTADGIEIINTEVEHKLVYIPYDEFSEKLEEIFSIIYWFEDI